MSEQFNKKKSKLNGILGVVIVIVAIAWSLRSCFNLFKMSTDDVNVESSEIEGKLDEISHISLSGYRDSPEEKMYMYIDDEKIGEIYTKGIFKQVMHIVGGKDKKELGTIGGSKEEMRKDSGACYAIKDGSGQIKHYLQDEIVEDGALPRDWYYVFYNKNKERIAYFADDGSTYGPFIIYSMEGTQLASVDYELSFHNDVNYEITFSGESDEIDIIDALVVLHLKNHSIVAN